MVTGARTPHLFRTEQRAAIAPSASALEMDVPASKSPRNQPESTRSARDCAVLDSPPLAYRPMIIGATTRARELEQADAGCRLAGAARRGVRVCGSHPGFLIHDSGFGTMFLVTPTKNRRGPVFVPRLTGLVPGRSVPRQQRPSRAPGSHQVGAREALGDVRRVCARRGRPVLGAGRARADRPRRPAHLRADAPCHLARTVDRPHRRRSRDGGAGVHGCRTRRLGPRAPDGPPGRGPSALPRQHPHEDRGRAGRRQGGLGREAPEDD